MPENGLNNANNSGANNECLDVTGNSVSVGAIFQQWQCTGDTNQSFAFKSAGDGLYTIEAQNSNLCLDYGTGATVTIYGTSYPVVVQNTCSGTSTQQWVAIVNSDGSYTFQTQDGAGCMNVGGNTAANGNEIIIYSCGGYPNAQNEKFVLQGSAEVKPSPTPSPSPNPSPPPAPPSPSPSPSKGGRPLLGVMDQEGGFLSWYPHNPDMTQTNGWQTPNAESDSPSMDNGFPYFGTFFLLGSSDYLSVSAAAAGQYNAAYAVTAQQYNSINDVYMIDVASEWYANWENFSPFHNGQPYVNPVTFTKMVCNAIVAIKQNVKNANVKINFDAPISAGTGGPAEIVAQYWPDGRNGNAKCDQYIDTVGYDIYFLPIYYGPTSAGAWAYWQPILNMLASWSQQVGKPIVLPQWGEGYGDGYIITQMAAWMQENNVVAHVYWNSGDSFPAGTSTQIHPNSTNAAAFIQAFDVNKPINSFWPVIYSNNVPGFY